MKSSKKNEQPLAEERNSWTCFTVYGKTHIFVIPFTVNVHGEPRRAARRGISLLLCLNQREIPHFVRNDKINYFFRRKSGAS